MEWPDANRGAIRAKLPNGYGRSKLMLFSLDRAANWPETREACPCQTFRNHLGFRPLRRQPTEIDTSSHGSLAPHSSFRTTQYGVKRVDTALQFGTADVPASRGARIRLARAGAGGVPCRLTHFTAHAILRCRPKSRASACASMAWGNQH